jgi:type II secretory pathway component GspD/PulD (secretin)
LKKKNKSLISIFIILIFLSGCAAPGYYEKAVELGIKEDIVKSESPIKIIEVKNFVSIIDDLDNLKGVNEKVNIRMSEGILFEDLIGFFKDKGINVVLKVSRKDEKGNEIKSEQNKDKKDLFILPIYEGTIKGFLRAVQDAAGVFYRVNDGTLTIMDTSQVFIKVIYSSQVKEIEEVLKAFGVKECKYDKIMNRVVFQSDYETFRKLKEYFLNSPLSVAEINFVVIENTVSKSSSIGIDWSQFSALLDKSINLAGKYKIVGSSSGAFSISAQNETVSLSAVLTSLESYKKYGIVQNCNMSVANGEKAVLEVQQKYPYVSSISLSSLSTNSASTVQSTSFENADAGLTLTLSPIIDDNVISMAVEMKYQSIIEYMIVGTQDQMVSRPVIATRNIKTIASLQAGDVMRVGSLRYKESSEQTSGLYKINKAGLSKDDEKWIELTALMGVNIKRYILK